MKSNNSFVMLTYVYKHFGYFYVLLGLWFSPLDKWRHCMSYVMSSRLGKSRYRVVLIL